MCNCNGFTIILSWFWKPEIKKYMVEVQCIICDHIEWVEMTREELGVK